MAYMNQCPLCGKQNCFEIVEFYIDSIKYSGIKCVKCNSMLHSHKVQTEEDVEYIKARFKELSDYPR